MLLSVKETLGLLTHAPRDSAHRRRRTLACCPFAFGEGQHFLSVTLESFFQKLSFGDTRAESLVLVPAHAPKVQASAPRDKVQAKANSCAFSAPLCAFGASAMKVTHMLKQLISQKGKFISETFLTRSRLKENF